MEPMNGLASAGLQQQGHEEQQPLFTSGGDDINLRLGRDVMLRVLERLLAPRDLAGAMVVCRLWEQIVQENLLWRTLALRLCPGMAAVGGISGPGVACCAPSPATWRKLDLRACVPPGSPAGTLDACSEVPPGAFESRAYARLCCQLSAAPDPGTSIIAEPLAASSTDNSPAEGIAMTLHPLPRCPTLGEPLYWSSRGSDSHDAPETLLYRLAASVCVVSEIRLRPFRAYFQEGAPIYSPVAVKVRLGHLKPGRTAHGFMEEDRAPQGSKREDKRDRSTSCVWTYESPAFPIRKVDELQCIKFPAPVLCLGGLLQVELLGRTQVQRTDGRYYICITHVKAVGVPVHGFEAQPLAGGGQHGSSSETNAMQLICVENLGREPRACSPAPPLLTHQEAADTRALLLWALQDKDEGKYGGGAPEGEGPPAGAGSSSGGAATSAADLALWEDLARYVRQLNAECGPERGDMALLRSVLVAALTRLGRRHLQLLGVLPALPPGPAGGRPPLHLFWYRPGGLVAAGRGVQNWELASQMRPGNEQHACFVQGQEVARDVWRPPHPRVGGWWDAEVGRLHYQQPFHFHSLADDRRRPGPGPGGDRAGWLSAAEREAVNGALLALQAAGLGAGFQGLHEDLWEEEDDEEDGVQGPGNLAWANDRED